jgi:hypothetical protein
VDEKVVWARQFLPLGSGRLDRKWLAERWSWLDENGIPQSPAWGDQDGLNNISSGMSPEEWKNREDALEIEGHDQLFHDHFKLLQKHPRMRQQRFKDIANELTSQQKAAEKNASVKAEGGGDKITRHQIDLAIRKLSSAYRLKIKQKLDDGMTRKQLIDQIIGKGRGKSRSSKVLARQKAAKVIEKKKLKAQKLADKKKAKQEKKQHDGNGEGEETE